MFCAMKESGQFRIVLRKVGIPTLSADSGTVPDNSRIAQGVYILL